MHREIGRNLVRSLEGLAEMRRRRAPRPVQYRPCVKVCVIHLLVTVLAIPRYGGRAAGPGSLHHGKWVRDGGGIRMGLGDEGGIRRSVCRSMPIAGTVA